MAGVRNVQKEIDFAELCDFYSYKELQHIDAIGVFKNLKKSLRDGVFEIDGSFPVNPSGGALGIGYMPEATTLYQLYYAYLQLKGKINKNKIQNAKKALIQSWRGIPTSSGSALVISS